MRAIERHHRLSLRAQLTVWVALGVLAVVAAMAAWFLSVLRQDPAAQPRRGTARAAGGRGARPGRENPGAPQCAGPHRGRAGPIRPAVRCRTAARALREPAAAARHVRLHLAGRRRRHRELRPAATAGPRRSSIADRAYFQQVLRTGLPVLSEPLAGRVTGEPGVVFAAPVRNQQGAIVAVLGGVVFLNRPGHVAGDAVLREFGARLKATVRVTDVAARLAGDEFVVLLEGVPSKAEAERVAQKIVEAIRVEFLAAGAPLLVTTSLGLGFAAAAGMSPPGRPKGESLRPEAEGTSVTAEALMHAADEALYKAKRAGRDGWQLQPCGVPPAAAAA